LFRAFPTEKMAYGFWMMSNRGNIKNSKDFENSRILVRQWLSKTRKGENNPMFGRVGPMTGRQHSDETKRKMSISRVGSKRSKETKKLMSKLQKERGGYGPKVFSEEQRLRMSVAGKGKNSKPKTDEHKKKLSESQKGRPGTTGMLGRNHSDESRLKISRTSRAKDLQPWETSAILSNLIYIDLWKKLDIVHEHWLKFNNCGHRRICTAMGIPVASSVETMVRWLRKNGDPKLNNKWIQFKETNDNIN
jgi:hypothetical protein